MVLGYVGQQWQQQQRQVTQKVSWALEHDRWGQVWGKMLPGQQGLGGHGVEIQRVLSEQGSVMLVVGDGQWDCWGGR